MIVHSQSVVLDFFKAFNSVPHNLLLEKFISADVTYSITRWIRDFLSKRYQRVVLKGVHSSTPPVTSGVPQGSVFGPVLSLLYINDIFESVSSGTLHMYADDA